MKKIFTLFAIVLLAVHLSFAQSATSRQGVNYAGVYSSIANYHQSDLILSSGIYYLSLVANNTGNAPAMSPTQWSPIGGGSGGVTPTGLATLLTGSPFNIAGIDGLLFGSAAGTPNESTDWKYFPSGGTLGGDRDFELVPTFAVSPMIALHHSDGSAELANGNFAVDADGDLNMQVLAAAAGSTFGGVAPCTTNCPTATNIAGGSAYSLLIQSAANTTIKIATVPNAFVGTDGSGHITFPTTIPSGFLPATVPQILSGYNVNIPFTEGTGTVAQDTSGNGNDCTFGSGSNAPIWITGGIDHLTAPGVAQTWCTLPASVTTADLRPANSRTVTWCGYLRPDLSDVPNFDYQILIASSRQDGAGSLNMSGSINNPFSGFTNGYASDFTSAIGHLGTWTTQPSIGWQCVTVTKGSTTDSTFDHLYIDDTEVGNYGAQDQLWDLRQAGDYERVGEAPWDGSAFSVSKTSYVLEYPTVLTPAQVAQNYRALQYVAFYSRGVGLAPTQNSSPSNQLTCNGDSLTNGSPGGITNPCNSSGFPTALNSTFQITNIGKSGSVLKSHVAAAPIVDVPLYTPFGQYNFAFEQAGINDLHLDQGNAATVTSDRIAWANRVSISGYKPIWLTMISSVGQDTNVQAVNAALRNAAAGAGVTLVDIAEDPCLGATGAYANPSPCSDFQGDGLYYNQTGADAARNYMANVVNYLTGSTIANPTLVTAGTHAILPGEGYISATPSGSASALTLPSCIGFSTTTPFTVYNASVSATVTVAPPFGQNLNGGSSALTIPNIATATFVVYPVSPSMEGCFWKGATSPMGGASGPTIQTAGANNGSQAVLNFIVSTVNASGLIVTPVNSSATEKFEITGTPSTATALAATPSLCPTGQAPTGITANGNATGCASVGGTQIGKYWQLFVGGDSYLHGDGSSSISRSEAALIYSDMPVTNYRNSATFGAAASLIFNNTFNQFAPTPGFPSFCFMDGGANDASNDTTSPTSVSSPSLINYYNQVTANITWCTLPYSQKMMASTAAKTGTWNTGGIPAPPTNGTQGFGLTNAVATNALTFTFMTPTNVTSIILNYAQTNAATGTFTVTVDGTLVNERCSGTTTWSKGPCSGVGFTDSGSSAVAQIIPVTGASSHTVVITQGDSTSLSVTFVGWFLPAPTPLTNTVVYQNTYAGWARSALYNSALSNAITALQGIGQAQIILADLNNPITYNGVTYPATTAADVSTTPNGNCNGAVSGPHLNDCGQAKARDIVEATAAVAGYPFAFIGAGGNTSAAGFGITHLYWNTNTVPTFAAGAAISGATAITVSGNSNDFVITLHTPASPTASASFGVITFQPADNVQFLACDVNPQGQFAAALPGGDVYTSVLSSTQLGLAVGTTALTGATTYSFHLHCT